MNNSGGLLSGLFGGLPAGGMLNEDLRQQLAMQQLSGLSQGLLAASGPSRMPVSLGQAMAQGMQQGQANESQFLNQALKLREADMSRQLREMQMRKLEMEMQPQPEKPMTEYQRRYLDIMEKRNNLDASSKGKPPSGYRWGEDGESLEPIPGGPGESISAELAARLGLANKVLKELPALKQQVGTGAATGPLDYMTGAMGYGEAGQISRRIADGADAIQRMLTGAGMPASEAAEYTKRFRISPTDTAEIVSDKLNNMENVLKEQIAMATRGKGGPPPLGASAPAMPQAATGGIKFLGFE